MSLTLTDEQRKRIYALHGVAPDSYDIELQDDDNYNLHPRLAPQPTAPEPETSVTELASKNLKPSGLESTARAAASSVLPTAAGLLATSGALALAPEPFLTKIGALGTLGLAGVAGLAGSFGASKLQDAVVPEDIKQKLFTRPEDIEAHPYLSAAGGFVPSALAFKPSLQDLKTLGSGVRNLSWAAQGAAGALSQAEQAALMNAAANIAPAAGMEAYEVATGEKPFDPLQSALNILPGALFTRPTALGNRLGFHTPESSTVEPSIPVNEVSVQEAPVAKQQAPIIPQSGVAYEGASINPEGQVKPLGRVEKKTNKAQETSSEVVGPERPAKSAAESAEVLTQAQGSAEQKRLDYETAIKEKAKQDVEELYNKAREEAIQGKLVGSAVTRSEESVRPSATTELGKDILPDYTGVQEHDTRSNLEQPLSEAEWIQERFDRMSKYQEAPEGDTSNTESRTKEDKFLADFEAEARRRGLTVKFADEIKGPDGKIKRGSFNPKTREVTISKSRNKEDTFSHEVGHGYVDDLLASAKSSDHEHVLRGLEFADENGRKFKTKKDWEALNPEERTSIEERFVQQLGEEGAKQRKAELYGTKREKFSKWLENTGSNLKSQLGVGEGVDTSRKLAVSQRHDQRDLRAVEQAEAPVAVKNQDLSDYEQYQEVQQKIKEAISKGEYDGPEFQKLWKENEVIKNRNGGMPPKEPTSGEKFQSADKESASAKPFISPSRYDKVSKLGKTGEEVSSQLQKFNSEASRLEGQIGNKLIGQLKDYSDSEIGRVYKYRHAKSNGLEEPFKLTANEQKLKTALDTQFKEAGQRIIDSGLEIKDDEDYRKMRLKPEGYQPNIIAQKVIHAWQERTPDAAKYDKLYTDYIVEKGLSPKEASDTLLEYKKAVGNAGVTPDIKFGAIRKAEGKGLPFELVEQNPALAYRRYGRRAASDLAYYQHIQSNPRMIKALGIKDQYGKSFEEQAPDIQEKHKDVDWIGGSQEVKEALRSVYGIDTPMNQKANAFIRAVANSVIGTPAAIRNIAGLPTSFSGYYGVTPKTLVEALIKVPERAARAFENNAVRSSFKDFDAAGVIEGNPDKFVDLADKYSKFMRKWSGRDFSDKFEGELSYSLGETLAHQWFAQAKTGDIKARRMLNRFGNTIEDVKSKFLPKEEVTPEDISKVAKNFVDATRGSYSAGGLPSAAIEGGAAPMLSLSRWSIEKFDTFQKDVVRPITEHGDWTPLLKTAFTGLLTGAGIEKLNELLTQKKGADATINETLAKPDLENLTAKAIGLLQLGGFGGMLSEAAKAGAGLLQGKDMKFNSPVSMPALTLIETAFQDTAHALEAAQQGEDKLDVLSYLMTDILKATYQNYRLVEGHANPEERERKEKFRDMRTYRELNHEPRQGGTSGNPYLGLGTRDFNRAGSMEEAASELPQALETLVKKGKGEFLKTKEGLEGLKTNSYQTFPKDPIEASKYYSFLVDSIGVDKANERYIDYLKQSAINKAKGEMVPSL